jgi:peptidoglycan/LPS O-acetylase OafA/YrhL
VKSGPTGGSVDWPISASPVSASPLCAVGRRRFDTRTDSSSRSQRVARADRLSRQRRDDCCGRLIVSGEQGSKGFQMRGYMAGTRPWPWGERMRRIDQLDWLRGLMALSILFYHSASFANLSWNVDSSTILGKLGIYGVSIFFVLSGLSLAHVYHARLGNVAGVASFLVRRAFRIWPLLSFAVMLVAIPAWMKGHPFNLDLIVANMTGLFGFIRPAAYINAGAWSIGNEMVFYALTPALLFAYSRSKTLGNGLVAATMVVGVIFAFRLLSPIDTLPEQWAVYINPFNNLFLFAVGVAIFYNLSEREIPSSWKWPVFLSPLVLFVALPANGDQIHIVTGPNRIAMSLISIAVVIGFYKAAPQLPSLTAKGLEGLGLISYGVYLLHPFAVAAMMKLFGDRPQIWPIVFVIGVCALTIPLASVVYLALERPFIRLGKVVTSLYTLPPDTVVLRLFRFTPFRVPAETLTTEFKSAVNQERH